MICARWFVVAMLAGCAASPRAFEIDPPHDNTFPADMVVLHIPVADVHVNGVAYVAAGKGPHPVVVLLHGLPGNEKNLDLAQAIRRTGWTVVTLNYRGSWGSPGAFSFAHALEDARAALTFVRQPETAIKLRADPKRIVVAGHSMGGWVTALVGGPERVAGAILFSTGDMGSLEGVTRPDLVAGMASSMESLAGTAPETLADELIANTATYSMVAAAPTLQQTPLLALTSDDGGAIETQRFVAAIRAAGGSDIKEVHVATDHAWSDARVRLSREITTWLARFQ